MYKLQPIRHRKRKIGRNENCPCGRTKEQIVTTVTGVYSHGGIAEDTEPFDIKRTVPMKYKRCCGKIENQRMMAAVRRHISQTIYSAVHSKKVSRLRRALDLFKKN